MRRLPLVMLALLIPAQAVSAVHYHTKSTTYACVDPRALNARNPIARARGRCFRVLPRETWERITRSGHSLMLLRIKPPHPGEPPLFFRRSALVLIHPHHRLARHHRHDAAAAALAAPRGIEDNAAVASSTQPSPLQPVPAPEPAQPARDQPGVPAIAASAQSDAQARAHVPGPAAQNTALPEPASVEPARTPSAAIAPAAPDNAAHREKPRARPMLWPLLLWPLLLWAVMIGFAGLLVRLIVRRRPDEAAAAPIGRRQAAMTPNSSIWEPVHPELSGIVERLDTNTAGHAQAPADLQQEPLAEAAETVTTEPSASQPQGAAEPVSLSEYKNGCVARLRHAGWDARTRFTGGQRGPDVIARHNGLVLALQCHPSASPVDVEAVEDACLVRERQRSDLAAIVSNATYTDAARQLAARTGIVLLHEDQLASFAA